jgi:hypothetical protein
VNFVLRSDFVPEVPFIHFAAWHQARHGGLLGCSFAEYFPELVQYRPGMKPRMSPGLEEHPERFRWSRDGGYDYYLLHTLNDLGAELARRAGKPLPLVAHAGNWWLYQNPPPHESP